MSIINEIKTYLKQLNSLFYGESCHKEIDLIESLLKDFELFSKTIIFIAEQNFTRKKRHEFHLSLDNLTYCQNQFYLKNWVTLFGILNILEQQNINIGGKSAISKSYLKEIIAILKTEEIQKTVQCLIKLKTILLNRSSILLLYNNTYCDKVEITNNDRYLSWLEKHLEANPDIVSFPLIEQLKTLNQVELSNLIQWATNLQNSLNKIITNIETIDRSFSYLNKMKID